MKKLYALLLTLFLTLTISSSYAQMINEFEPNPNGADPTDVTFELKGTPSAAFDLWILSIESDGFNGTVDRAANVTGSFDANGLATVMVPDLENPSFTVVLTDNFTGMIGDDLDGANDGTLDTSSLGTILDAVGISDSVSDDATLYGASLGGTDILYNGIFEPFLAFRDGTNDDWYNVVLDLTPDPDENKVFDATGTQLNPADFDLDPALTTFGSVNPSFTMTAGPNITISGTVGDLDYVFGMGPSAEDTFTVEATDLGADLIVTAPTDFEVSLSSGTGFASSVNISPDMSGAVATTTIYVRLQAMLAVGNYSGNVTASSAGALDRTIAVAGEVSPDVTCTASAGDIIITEIMQNPSAVSDTNGEYFEVYNTTGSAIDMNGWVISDAGTESHAIASSVVVPANGYAVLGRNADTMANGGLTLDYEYANIFLGNSDDEVILSCGMTVIDQVFYDGGPNFPDPTGSSMQLLLTAYNATDNDDGANWGEGIATYGDGDVGTPGAANDFVLSVDQLDNVNFSIYPNPTNTGYVTITSSSNDAMNVQVFDILGKQVKQTTLTNSSLNVSDLRAGVYIVKISQNNASTTKKLVIR